jgi:hypothetical protein
MQEDNYGLLDWINIRHLNLKHLSKNPNAIHIFETRLLSIDWLELSQKLKYFFIVLLKSITENAKNRR